MRSEREASVWAACFVVNLDVALSSTCQVAALPKLDADGHIGAVLQAGHP